MDGGDGFFLFIDKFSISCAIRLILRCGIGGGGDASSTFSWYVLAVVVGVNDKDFLVGNGGGANSFD